MKMEEGIRLQSGLISIVAAATSTTGFILPLGKRAIIKKIHWRNRSGSNADLTIGYTNLAAAFVAIFPNILMVNGVDDGFEEGELPIMGNTPEGFMANTTALTGTLGNIILCSSVAGAAPADVQITLEVEVL